MRICEVSPESVGAELGLEAGDELIGFDDAPANDLLDYLYYDSQEAFTLKVRREGKDYALEVEKDEEETLGLTFADDGLEARRCQNHCVFCFIDQLPEGMRETLYVKDDDYRHSFIYGNYVTLTNLRQQDIDRILAYRLSPLYVSVHTTDGELRKRMTGNRFAGNILELLRLFAAHGIALHTQIVMVPGYNDGAELERTLTDLSAIAGVRSCAVVPLGTTGFRAGLAELAPVTADVAARTIDLVQSLQSRLQKEGNPFHAWCSDEFYLKAGRPVPAAEDYAEFAQIEDGVGILAKFRRDLDEELDRLGELGELIPADIVSGTSAFAFLREEAARVRAAGGPRISVHEIKNRFFGESITVSGLLTGRDLAEQLAGNLVTDRLILPGVMLRDRRDVFLDDMTVQELADRLQVNVYVSAEGHFLAAFRRDAEPAGRFCK